MELKKEEQILKVYRRHLFPYMGILMKCLLLAAPFYLIVYFIAANISDKVLIISLISVTGGMLAVIAYASSFYWADKLMVTNQRVLFVNWLNFFSRVEDSAELMDIQDIATKETGVLSYFKIFDFGTIEIRTASAKVVITFDRAPDPEGIKNVIEEVKANHLMSKNGQTREHQGIKEQEKAKQEILIGARH